jgi:hypothetical protein
MGQVSMAEKQAIDQLTLLTRNEAAFQ